MERRWLRACFVGAAWLAAMVPAARAEMQFSPRQITWLEGARFTGVVASFTETGAPALVRGTTAQIRWGDGESSRGVIVRAPNGSFLVAGRHLYRRRGLYPVLVDIDRSGTRLSTVQSHATVADAGFRAFGRTTRPPAPTANQRYVNHLYQDLLNRPADPTALATLVATLNSGTPRATVVQSILTSAEFRSHLIGSFYQEMLERAATAEEVATMLALLQSEATIEHIQSLILASEEFYDKAGGTDALFLGGLYQHVLRRDIDPEALETLLAALEEGATRQEIANSALTSSEARTRFIQNIYQEFLDRAATSTEVTTLVNALQSGARLEAVVATILASAEYFAWAPSSIDFSGVVGVVLDRNLFGGADEYSATIDWGDGETSAGTLVRTSRGRFAITGSHTYQTDAVGSHALTITVNHGVGDPIVIESEVILD